MGKDINNKWVGRTGNIFLDIGENRQVSSKLFNMIYKKIPSEEKPI